MVNTRGGCFLFSAPHPGGGCGEVLEGEEDQGDRFRDPFYVIITEQSGVRAMKRLPIGISDFKELIENDYIFADTTGMIGDIYRETAKIILLTRPRRFGKTLNMSMLSYFFDNRLETAPLFKGFDVSRDPEMMGVVNSFPAIFLSFKDVKNNTWEVAYDKLKTIISDLFHQFEEDLQIITEDAYEGRYYKAILNGTASNADYQDALKNLTKYLNRAYDKPVILLIDEYDVPIQSGWSCGYYEEVIDFMRGLLSGALKDNSYLFKGVLTGIYRVAKESIFSGLNNLSVFTLMEKDYATYFGFTETEVEELLETYSVHSNGRADIKTWYNGYNFGDHIIYNPWSILNYLRFHELKPYWINTSSNDLIKETIDKNLKEDETFRVSIEEMIAGEKVEKRIDDASALREMEYDPDAIWTLFLFSGYLKAENPHKARGSEDIVHDCSIPNTEVTRFYKKTVINWLQRAGRNIIYDLADPLVKGEGRRFGEKLKRFVMETLSYYDINSEPENTYHMILLGIFAHLSGGYWIKSNRESGEDRYDICLKAKDRENYSAVIEIKASADKVQEGMEQIEEKEYLRELESEGYEKILKLSLGVNGKRMEVLAL